MGPHQILRNGLDEPVTKTDFVVSDPQQMSKMSHLYIDTCMLAEYFPDRIEQV